MKAKKGRSEFLSFMRYVRSLHPLCPLGHRAGQLRPAPLSATCGCLGQANNVEFAYTPHYASWLNRIEAQFTALRYFCLDGTDHESHDAQAFLIRRYIAWRNRHAHDKNLRALVKRANVA